MKLNETISILSDLFGEKSTELQRCFIYLSLTIGHDEDWRTYAYCFNTVFELYDFSIIEKDHLKDLLLFSSLQEFCQLGDCCRILEMIEESDGIILENLFCEYRKTNIKFDSGMNQ